VKTTKLVFAAACASALTVGLITAPAQAAPVTGKAGIAAVGGMAAVRDAATGQASAMSAASAQQALDAYWTKDRMKAATPVVEADGAASTTATPAKERVKPMRAEEPMAALLNSAGGVGTQDAAFSFTTGRIFFFDPEERTDKWCSGGAATGTRRRLVLTAAHCVHGGPGRTWKQNWVFVAGYQAGNEPVGRFSAFQFWVLTPWLNDRDRHYDYSFVITNNNQFGQRVVDAVGGHGLVSNAGRPFVHVAGYPGNRDGGEIQWYCWGTTSRRSLFNSDQKIGCAWGGGSSGGPWLRDYNHTNGLGMAISVTSSGPDCVCEIYGPYFDDALWTLRDAANNASPA